MRYTGELYDARTDLYHLRARQYDAGLGRFTATDPVWPSPFVPYPSAYAYVGSRPTAMTDPSGMVAVGGEVASSGHCEVLTRSLGVEGKLCPPGLMVGTPIDPARQYGDGSLGDPYTWNDAVKQTSHALECISTVGQIVLGAVEGGAGTAAVIVGAFALDPALVVGGGIVAGVGGKDMDEGLDKYESECVSYE